MLDAYGIHLGPLYIHFYALVLLGGILAAAWLASREALRRGFAPGHVWDMLIVILVLGIIGARLYHVLTPSPSTGITPAWYFAHPLEILAVWNGGLGIYGALVGGALGLWLYTWRHKLDFWTWLDIAAPAIPLGQAIGRWGNFVNQELYGAPTTLPWAIYIPPEKRLPGYEAFAYYHPTFLYESLWNLGVCLLLLWIARRFAAQLKRGDLLTLYFVFSPPGRILTEFFRLDSTTLFSLSVAQSLSALLVGAALLVFIFRHKALRRSLRTAGSATSKAKALDPEYEKK